MYQNYPLALKGFSYKFVFDRLTGIMKKLLEKSGGAVVYWIGSKGCGFDSRQCLAHFVLQQDTLSTLLLSTQVYKWVPGRMQTLFVA